MSTIVGNQNLRVMWEQLASERANHLFLSFESREGVRKEYSYERFDRLINKTANALIGKGISRGDKVAVQLYNSPEHIAACFALAKIGAVAVPLNMQHTLPECSYIFDSCGIDSVIAEPDCQYYYCSDDPHARESVYKMRNVLICHADGAELFGSSVDFDALVSACDDVLRFACEIDPLDDAMIIFTSGTTSAPKGVELTHANMLFGGYYGDWQCGLGPEDRLLTTMPAFHSNFQTAALMPVLTAGATLVYIEKYSARRFWKQVREYRATAIQMVAMMARTMMLQPVDEGERCHCVKSVQYYLAISQNEKEAFEERFAVRLQNCYGLTESVCWVLTDFAFGPRRWPSIGRVGLGYEVMVADESGNELEAGSAGEILVRGIPGVSLMKGYLGKPDITASTIDGDGWLHTGDTGYVDEAGWFYFVDRKTNMIKRAGENISSTEVEDVLMHHPSVKETAVIGVDDPIRDQAVKAFVVLKDGASADADSIISFCKGILAHFKVPTIVEFVDELPHTSVGKVAKKLLS